MTDTGQKPGRCFPSSAALPQQTLPQRQGRATSGGREEETASHEAQQRPSPTTGRRARPQRPLHLAEAHAPTPTTHVRQEGRTVTARGRGGLSARRTTRWGRRSEGASAKRVRSPPPPRPHNQAYNQRANHKARRTRAGHDTAARRAGMPRLRGGGSERRGGGLTPPAQSHTNHSHSPTHPLPPHRQPL